MGTWGTAISSNDTFADVYGSFFDLYNNGLKVRDISKKLIEENQETIDDTDDCNNFWFALAKAQWECKELEKELFHRIKNIVETDADLEVWRNLDADEKDIKKRKQVLEKFLSELEKEKPKAKAKKKKIIRQPKFEKGTCLTFLLSNGNYGGAVVLEAINDTELGLNLIATTRLNHPYKPSLQDFENSQVLILSFPHWKNHPDINWHYLISLKRDKLNVDVVGKLSIEIDYDPKDYGKDYHYGGSIDQMKKKIEMQFVYEQNNPKTQKVISIKKLTKKSKWKLW